ncbi:MAG: cyclic-phosphate processing receiver domain-containing protein [Candidatus Acidiferrales bacterium]
MKTILIPHDATILIVEDDIGRRSWFLSRYRLPGAYLAHEPAQAIELVRRIEPTWVWLDFDLGLGKNSLDVAAFLRDTGYDGRVIVHSQNDFGRLSLKQFLPRAEVHVFGTFEIRRTR